MSQLATDLSADEDSNRSLWVQASEVIALFWDLRVAMFSYDDFVFQRKIVLSIPPDARRVVG